MTALNDVIANNRIYSELIAEEGHVAEQINLADRADIELANMKIRMQNQAAKIADLEALVASLSYDPSYQITTRPAIAVEMRKIAQDARWVLYIDIDKMHEANKGDGGKEAVNQKIARAVNIRAGDVLLRARYFSGDELIFILSCKPDGFCKRLTKAFAAEGMTFTYAYKKFSGNVEKDAAILDEQISATKANRR